MRPDAGPVLVRQRDVIGADRHQAAIPNLQLTMQLNEQLSLSPVLGAIPSAAEHKNQGMLTLQRRELAALRSMIGEFVVGKDRAGHNIGSHDLQELLFAGSPVSNIVTCFEVRSYLDLKAVAAALAQDPRLLE